MRAATLFVVLFFSAAISHATEFLALTPFSTSPAGTPVPSQWREVTMKKIPAHTRYSLVQDGSSVVLRADANASMSSLRHRVDVDPIHMPTLHWRWKIENLIAKSALGRKDGDDFPARVYVFFDYPIERLSLLERMKLKLARSLYGDDLPLAVLCYVWDQQAAVNTIAPSPYTDRVRMIVAESGATRLNQWVEVSRNIEQDFRAAFGEAAPRVIGVALATDTDNTGASATAYYGDFQFEAMNQ
jgi:hypothetical protein